MALEGINQVGHLKKADDNPAKRQRDSISPNVGALSGYLNRIRSARPYNDSSMKSRVAESYSGFRRLMLSSAKAVKDTLCASLHTGRDLGRVGAQVSGSHQRPRYQFNSYKRWKSEKQNGSGAHSRVT